MVIENFPTIETLGGIFTKLLQGALFRKFRVEIMNIPDDINMYKMFMDRKGVKRGLP